MILTPHLLVGAAIATKIKFLPLPLTLLLAFLSHYLLDSLPHWEPELDLDDFAKNIKKRRWKKVLPNSLKVFPDFFLGLLIIFIFSKNLPLAMAGGFLGVLPDGLMFLSLISPNKLLKLHSKFKRKIYFPKNKKVPLFWGIFTQILVMLAAIYFLPH